MLATPPKSPRAGRFIAGGVILVVAVVAVFLIAQGGGGGGTPLNAIAKAAEVTQREPGGQARIKATITSPDTPQGITESGEMTFEENGRTAGELTAVGLTTGKEMSISSIADGTILYFSSDAFDGELPEGKKWMELDLASAVKGGGSPDPVGGGPTEGLKVLEGVENSEEVGKEVVGGVPTTHYRGTLPTSDEVFGVKIDLSPPQIDVWVDAQERVRRTRLVISGTVGGVTTTNSMSIDYVEFGRVPKIEIPPASEVFNATGKVEEQIQSTAEGG